VEALKEAAISVLEEEGRQTLQYSTTEGFVPLRQKIADRMNNKFGTAVTYEEILITSGSQQGLDFSAKAFLNADDVALCECPTYLGAINAFNAYRPKLVEVPTDEYGIVPEELEKIINTTENVKMIYVIPDFQNPTGKTWTLERRIKFMEVVNKYEIPVIEDNPYGELRFEGEILPSLKSMDPKGLVIFLGTFSKILTPGLRIGWIAADKEILERYISIKQSADLHTSNLDQRIISRFMDANDLDANVEKIKKLYKKRLNIMIKTMEEEFPEGVKFTYPQGGLFTWVELPSYMNARDLLVKSLENDVAFVPGGAFYPAGNKENAMRLNYSNMSEERIVEGIKRLAKVIKEYIE